MWEGEGKGPRSARATRMLDWKRSGGGWVEEEWKSLCYSQSQSHWSSRWARGRRVRKLVPHSAPAPPSPIFPDPDPQSTYPMPTRSPVYAQSAPLLWEVGSPPFQSAPVFSHAPHGPAHLPTVPSPQPPSPFKPSSHLAGMCGRGKGGRGSYSPLNLPPPPSPLLQNEGRRGWCEDRFQATPALRQCRLFRNLALPPILIPPSPPPFYSPTPPPRE